MPSARSLAPCELTKGLGFVDEARRAGYRGQVLLVTAGISESDAAELLRRGISGVFTKHLSPTLLVQSIREVMQGKAWFEQDFLNRALELAVGSSEPIRKHLTERERLVLSFIFEGLGNKEIADRLHISEPAVKSSLQQLFAKTGVRTRGQLVRVALENYRDQL